MGADQAGIVIVIISIIISSSSVIIILLLVVVVVKAARPVRNPTAACGRRPGGVDRTLPRERDLNISK